MEVRLPGRRTVVTRPYPPSDPAFAAEVRAAMASCREQLTDADELRLAVTERLRAGYPNTRIVPQDPMASLVAGEEIWYVYRDAAVRTPDARRDHLYAVLSAARRTIELSQAVVDRSARLVRGRQERQPHRGSATPASGQLGMDEVELPPARKPSAPQPRTGGGPAPSDPPGA